MPHTPTLLLIEDHPEMLEMLSEALAMNALQIIQAENGAHALEWLATADRLPDLIITDWFMPLMDGVSLVQHIRDTPAWSHIPIVVITGSEEAYMKLKLQGVQGFLRKPFEVEALYATILTLLGNTP